MPFNRVGGGNAGETNPGNSVGFTWPASMNTNRLALCVACWYDFGSGITASTPTGFTKQGSDINLGGGSWLAVFTKACDGTETGALTCAWSSGTYGSWTFDVFDGDGDLTFASVSTPDTGTATDATAPSVSGTDGQGLVCAYGLTDPPGTVNSGPSGMTAGSLPSGTPNTNNARTYWQELTASGATGTKTFDYTNSRSFGGVSILINDAGAGGGGASALPILMNHYRQRRA